MIPSRVATLLLAASLLTAGTAFAEPTAKDVMRASAFQNRGSQALEINNVEKARKYFEQAIAILPYYSEAHFGLGHIALREQRYEDALAEYRKALDGYGQSSEVRFHLEQIRYRDAQDKIRELRDQQMNLEHNANASKLTEAGMNQSSTGLDQRIRQLEQIPPPSRAATPEPPGEAHFHVGNALFRLNRLDEARQEWETCIRKSPGFPIAHNNLAVIYFKQGRIAEAEQSLAKAESLGFKVSPEFKADLGRAQRPSGGTPAAAAKAP
jgi:tetratricopeptide (TPR) repeat protein